MNDTFNGWNTQISNLDVISNLICTGKTAKTMRPDIWVVKHLESTNPNTTVLDFGCGIGRNTFYFGLSHPNWNVVGYDNKYMISKINDFYKIHYNNIVFPTNVVFSDDWDNLKGKKFDVIFCSLVLQHIYEHALEEYISHFKEMTHKLIVSGRRFNDDSGKSTWEIIENNGLIPNKYYKNDVLVRYSADGDLEEHNLAIYEW